MQQIKEKCNFYKKGIVFLSDFLYNKIRDKNSFFESVAQLDRATAF